MLILTSALSHGSAQCTHAALFLRVNYIAKAQGVWTKHSRKRFESRLDSLRKLTNAGERQEMLTPPPVPALQ